MMPSMRNVAGVAIERVARALGRKSPDPSALQGQVRAGAAASSLSDSPGWGEFQRFLAARRGELMRLMVHGDVEQTPDIRAKLQEIDYLAAWQERAVQEGQQAQEILNGR